MDRLNGRSGRILLFGCLALASASAVGASWQFTRWGMTPEEVVAASPEPLIDASEETGIGPEASLVAQSGQKSLLRGKWTSGEFQFTSYFLFDSNRRLASVKILLADSSQAKNLKAALEQKYGKPEVGASLIEFLTWRTREETVFFVGTMKGTDVPVKVVYVSAKTPSNEGL